MIDTSRVIKFLQENPKLLLGIRRGIERECLRVTKDGRFPKTAHPKKLGCALTNPYITKDFSENLLELITPPMNSVDEVYLFLEELHKYVWTVLGDELLWPTSMPNMIERESDILVAQFGSSNIGKMKKVYRDGLTRRYGKLMQVIAGIHYNFSMPKDFWITLHEKFELNCSLQDFISARYMGAIRNFRRNGWVVPYLFGSSPALCRTFVKNLSGLSELTSHSELGMLSSSNATSLRMSDLGYKNKSQGELHISYDSVAKYSSSLIKAVKTKDLAWDRIGVEEDGVYKQLSTSILQVENEYYGTVRPKRVSRDGESPAMALKDRGVEYIEVRSIDVNPFSFCGINKDQIRLLDLLLLHAITSDSPLISREEEVVVDQNFNLVVNKGRSPNLKLTIYPEGELDLKVAINKLFSKLKPLADILDKAHGDNEYNLVVDTQLKLVDSNDGPISKLVLNELLECKEGYMEYYLAMAKKHQCMVKKSPLDSKRYKQLEEIACNSLKENSSFPESSPESFKLFLSDYFSRIN